MNALIATQGQTRVLLQYLEESTQSSCEQTLAQARDRARHILAAARKQARQDVSEAISDERSAIDIQLMRETAMLATAQRQQAQRRDLLLLESAYHMLSQTLLQRWSNDGHREQWIADAVKRAESLMSLHECTVRHASLANATFPEPERYGSVSKSTSLQAGLTISHAEVVVDASLSGLLENRVTLDARLLACYYNQVAHNV